MRHATARTFTEQAPEPVPPGASPPCELRLVDAAERERVERFVHAAYQAAYGARLTTFMPQLAAVQRGSQLVAACGLRYAADDALFVETYLDVAVERALSHAAGEAVERRGIVEVGNLAISRPGYARLLIGLLTSHLHARGDAWVVFTAVPALRNNFVALDIPLYPLGPARPERLPTAERAQWGRYYDSAPRVSAVRVADAARALGRDA